MKVITHDTGILEIRAEDGSEEFFLKNLDKVGFITTLHLYRLDPHYPISSKKKLSLVMTPLKEDTE